MNRKQVSFTVFVAVLVLCALAVTGFAINVCSMGAITVSVKEHGPCGDDISICVPASVASAALYFAPDDVFRHAGGSDFRGKLPLVRAACRAVAGAPDCVLVDISSGDENVRVRKVGGEIVIEADTDDESVHVRVPVKLVQHVLTRLAKSSTSSESA